MAELVSAWMIDISSGIDVGTAGTALVDTSNSFLSFMAICYNLCDITNGKTTE